MSFLQQGKWNRAALVLGFDPLALVQRALVTGTLLVGPRSAALPKTPAQLMRELRERRKAAGLTREGRPKTKFLKVHPALRGLPRREYLTRFMRLRRGKPTAGPIRPYRRASSLSLHPMRGEGRGEGSSASQLSTPQLST